MLSFLFACTVALVYGVDFKINGETTYKDAKDTNVRGILINAIFDNYNPEYTYLFEYPDTNLWDPTRNTNEFVSNLTTYKEYGMVSFTVSLQGGNPFVCFC